MIELIVHTTERGTFRQCKRKWKYQYVNRFQRGEVYFNALWFGTLIHKCMAYYYKHEIPLLTTFEKEFKEQTEKRYKELPSTAQEKVDEFYQLGKCMLIGYEQKYKKEKWEIVSVEEPYSYSIDVEDIRVTVQGTMDMVIRQDNRLWIVDHKTYAKFVDPTDLLMDDQMTTYLFLLQHNSNERIGGAIYNQLLKKIPDVPKVLQSGKISKDVKCYTTRAMYEAILEANNQDVNDYADILSKLDSIEFFRREPIARTNRELKLFKEQLHLELQDMVRFYKDTNLIYPNVSRSCKEICQYTDLCRCQSQGGDWEFMAKTIYKEHDTQHGTEMKEAV